MSQARPDPVRVVGVVIAITCLPTVGLSQARDAAAKGEAQMSTRDSGQCLDVARGKQLVLRYRYGGDVFKPYVAALYLPDGRNVLRDSPTDHKHHHALMFAWNVDGVEFWGEAGPVGRQVHRRFATGRAAHRANTPAIQEVLDWIGKDGKSVLLKERRTILLHVGTDAAGRLLTWRSDFVGPDAQRDVTITGRKYLGLGLRFAEPMDRGGRFMTADGETEVGKVNGSRSAWCAITGNVQPGKPITLAVFDDPANPRNPCTWFAMDTPFAYLSATIGLDGKPFVLKAGQRAVLRYGVAVWAEPVDAETVEKAYRSWRQAVGQRP